MRQGLLRRLLRRLLRNCPGRSFLIAALASLVFGAPATSAAQVRETGLTLEARFGPEFTESFTRTIQVGSSATLDLTNESGDVVITGVGGNQVTIDAVKRVRQLTEFDARTLLQEMVIRISERNGQVEVRTALPPEGNWSGGVDYTIALPDAASVTLRVTRGDLRITNIRGELRASTVSGNIVVSSLARLRDVKTISGDIEITDAEGETVIAGALNGNVIARNLKARSVDVDAKSGDIRFIDVVCDEVYLAGVTGEVEYTGRLAKGGRYRLQSHSGHILITPLGETGFELQANSFSGDIRSDYPFSDSPSPGQPNQSLRGTVGDASASVELRSYSGDIAIIKR